MHAQGPTSPLYSWTAHWAKSAVGTNDQQSCVMGCNYNDVQGELQESTRMTVHKETSPQLQ